ncbi:Ribonuclease Z [Clostridium neonatale]|nr:Ribonuclease Z [Clostridium neonatale]
MVNFLKLMHKSSNLNTSHVNLNQLTIGQNRYNNTHLNTSHVNLNLLKDSFICDLKNLNTSHVNLNLKSHLYFLTLQII